MMFAMDPPIVRIFKGVGYVTALLTLVFGLSRVWSEGSAYFARKAQVAHLIATSEIQRTGSDYRGAWETLEKAVAIQSSGDVVRHQEDVAMEWLRNIRTRDDET